MDTLLYLAETYFHQDWDTYAPTPLGVVDVFRHRESGETVDALRSELQTLLEGDPDEGALRDLWLRRGRADWIPLGGGWGSYREWFEAMLEIVS